MVFVCASAGTVHSHAIFQFFVTYMIGNPDCMIYMINHHVLIDWIGMAIINAGWIRVESTTFPQAAEWCCYKIARIMFVNGLNILYDNPRQIEHQVRGRGDNMTLAMSSTRFLYSASHDFFRFQPELIALRTDYHLFHMSAIANLRTLFSTSAL